VLPKRHVFEVSHKGNHSLSAQQYIYFIIIFKHNNYNNKNLLVRHVSTCTGHLQVTLRRNEGFGCLQYVHVTCLGCVTDRNTSYLDNIYYNNFFTHKNKIKILLWDKETLLVLNISLCSTAESKI
jgi:hypothetical protein